MRASTPVGSARASSSRSLRPAADAASASRGESISALARHAAWTRVSCRWHDSPLARRRPRLPSCPRLLVRDPCRRACKRRHSSAFRTRACPRLSAGLRRDDRRRVGDAASERATWRVGRGVCLRRGRPRGDPGREARLGPSNHRRRPRRVQTASRARAGCHARDRPEWEGPRRRGCTDSSQAASTMPLRRSALRPSPSRRSPPPGRAVRRC